MQLIRKRKTYNPSQFVGRITEFAYLRGWMAGQKQLLTITGPPGIGKTWFVNNSFQQLKANGQIAYMVELPTVDSTSDQNELSADLLQAWAGKLHIELNQDCPQAYGFDLGQEFSSQLERVAHDICHRCWPGQAIFFLLMVAICCRRRPGGSLSDRPLSRWPANQPFASSSRSRQASQLNRLC